MRRETDDSSFWTLRGPFSHFGLVSPIFDEEPKKGVREFTEFSYVLRGNEVLSPSEAHLHRILESYHRCRTHLSLAKDCPEPRAPVPPEQGRVVAFSNVGGLHHFYTREAA
jgi:hypothetical protein